MAADRYEATLPIARTRPGLRIASGVAGCVALVILGVQLTWDAGELTALTTAAFLAFLVGAGLLAAFAEKPVPDQASYALPLSGTGHDRRTARYRGFAREAISPAAKGSLAEMRLYERKGATIDGAGAFLTIPEEELDVLTCANEVRLRKAAYPGGDQ